jgi:hypothetical protein
MASLRGFAAARVADGWVRGVKRRLGYYRLRSQLLRPRFQRALRPTDVFLLGHPKSGNTWLGYLIATARSAEPEERLNLATVGEFVPCVHGRDHRIAEFAALPDPRVFRNEYPRYSKLYPWIIYLVRDPRAVIPSLWAMYRTMFDDQRTPIAAFLEQYLGGRGIFRHWNADLVRWDRQVDRALVSAEQGDRILLVRYEDLLADRRAELARVLAFAGIDPGPDGLARATERGGFAAMQAVEDRHGAEAYRGRALGEGRFVRHGRADGWREELPPEVSARIAADFGAVMLRAGYPV